MIDQSDFLERLVEKLSEADIPYMLVGSVAASFHGHPRSTFDIAVVVDADEETLCRFARSLGEGHFFSEESVRQAVRSRTLFNVIDEPSGYKADLILRNERTFSRMEFSRRIRVRVLDKFLEMATPEDVILSKLEWSKFGSSERQRNDALQVAKTKGKTLDFNYIEKWARKLGVVDIWKRIREVVFPEHNQEGASNV